MTDYQKCRGQEGNLQCRAEEGITGPIEAQDAGSNEDAVAHHLQHQHSIYISTVGVRLSGRQVCSSDSDKGLLQADTDSS